MNDDLKIRFEAKFIKTNDCWEWIGALRSKSGYGAMKINGKVIDAHRISYLLYKGEIPDRIDVCHTCDNRKCVNPSHLFLGSRSVNMKDAYVKGRLHISTLINNNTIADQDLIIIRKLLLENKSLKDISIELNIPLTKIKNLKLGRLFKSLEYK